MKDMRSILPQVVKRLIDVFEGGNFDAVLMDVRMQGINGVEAFRRMKSLSNSVGRSFL